MLNDLVKEKNIDILEDTAFEENEGINSERNCNKIQEYNPNSGKVLQSLVQGQLGLEDLNFNKNLMGTFGGKTWCEEGILSVLDSSNKGPNCRNNLSRESLKKNITITELLVSYEESQNKPIFQAGNKHFKQCEIYCDSGSENLGYKGLLTKTHKKHDVQSIEDLFETESDRSRRNIDNHRDQESILNNTIRYLEILVDENNFKMGQKMTQNDVIMNAIISQGNIEFADIANEVVINCNNQKAKIKKDINQLTEFMNQK